MERDLFFDKGAAKTRIENKIFLLPNDFDNEGYDPALAPLPNLHRRNAMIGGDQQLSVRLFRVADMLLS